MLDYMRLSKMQSTHQITLTKESIKPILQDPVRRAWHSLVDIINGECSGLQMAR
jgi:hypothetical protein